MVTRQGVLWANILRFSCKALQFGLIETTQRAKDDLAALAARTMSGMLCKCTAVFKQ